VLGTTEIAEMLGMSVGTTSRFMITLADQGYLERDASRKYRLTLRATELGMGALNEIGLCRHARHYLQELARRSGYTVALGVLDGPEVLLVDLLPSARGSQSRDGGERGPGSSLPAYCTAIGKVLLANLGADRRSRLIAELAPGKHGPNTILTPQFLRAELGRVRDDGLAVNDEEAAAGTRAIAAPVRDEAGDVVAAVGLATHDGAIELDDLVDRFTGRLITTAQRISARLGYLGVDE
jgi:IclR family pca regulon transcriptional regulator